jgi:outer membrane beta-barrel protein
MMAIQKSLISVLVAGLLMAALAGLPNRMLLPYANAACPEPPESQTGLGSGLQKKDFLKALRHEVNLYGGLLMSDVMGKAPKVGVSYAFHFNEDLALEASFAWAKFSSTLSKPLSRATGYDVLPAHDARLYLGSLVWDPFHGKFILTGATIVHFDLFVRVGAGVTDSRTSRGLTYLIGGGIRLYLLSWLSLRLEVIDSLQVQEILASESLTNNLALLLGVGFWFPFSN